MQHGGSSQSSVPRAVTDDRSTAQLASRTQANQPRQISIEIVKIGTVQIPPLYGKKMVNLTPKVENFFAEHKMCRLVGVCAPRKLWEN